ncbi:MAG TPA: hypothetical protein VGP94_00045, partial [Tepidisphaeraceae bacterium]|nr:hypothetical protein [Tepidisphaeraceae bacterium]
MNPLTPESSAQPLQDVSAVAPPALIWEQRNDGLFIQIPPAPREKMSSGPDRAVFRWFMIFAFFSIVAASAYFARGMPPTVALVVLVILL